MNISKKNNPHPVINSLIAIGLSNIASGIVIVCLPLLIVQLTKSTLLVAILNSVFQGAIAIGGLFSGVLITQIDKIKGLIKSNVLRAFLLLLLFAIFQFKTKSIILVALIFIGLGLLELVFDAIQWSVVPWLVSATKLSKVNSYFEAVQSIGSELIGPIIVSALVGIDYLLYIPVGISFYLLGAFTLQYFIRPYRTDIRVNAIKGNLISSLSIGFEYLKTNEMIRKLLYCSVLLNFCLGAYGSVYVLFVLRDLRLSESIFSLLSTGPAIGAFIGVYFFNTVLNKISYIKRLAISALLIGISTFIAANSRDSLTLYISSIIFGTGLLTWNSTHLTIRQLVIPQTLFINIHTTLRSLSVFLIPVSALIGGLIANSFTIQTLYLLIALIECILVPLLWFYSNYFDNKLPLTFPADVS